MIFRRTVPIALLAALVFSCGGGNAATTADQSAPDEPATTAVVDEGTTETVTNLGDMPAECMESFRTFLRELEPFVEGRDFNTMTQTELAEFGEEIAGLSESIEAETADCPTLDMGIDENFELMIDIARDEAPGTVAYFEWIRDFAGSVTEVSTSGDCEANIAAVQEYVDRTESMNDLTMAELSAVGSLFGAITNTCSAERANQFFSEEGISDWMDTSG